jgi:hypothetical protein
VPVNPSAREVGVISLGKRDSGFGGAGWEWVG